MQKGPPSARFPSFERILHWLHAQVQQVNIFPLYFNLSNVDASHALIPAFLSDANQHHPIQRNTSLCLENLTDCCHCLVW